MGASLSFRLGPYIVKRELARGGMGIVYEAEDLAGIRVALKVPTTDLSDHTHRARFLGEMRILAQLHHPHIVRILQGGEDAGRLYFAMEYVEGETLEQVLARGPLPCDRAIAILRQIADALAFAHALEPAIVHRDLKPANVLVDKAGTVKITDFGIAKLFHPEGRPTTDPIGTVPYMSPEQLDGVMSGPPSDIHALGVVAFELLTGRTPFLGSLPLSQLVVEICQRPPPDLRELNANIPPSVAQLVAACLVKRPDDRPLARDIVARLAAPGPNPEVPSETPRSMDTVALVEQFEGRRRIGSGAWLSAAVIALLVSGGLGAYWLQRSAGGEQVAALPEPSKTLRATVEPSTSAITTATNEPEIGRPRSPVESTTTTTSVVKPPEIESPSPSPSASAPKPEPVEPPEIESDPSDSAADVIPDVVEPQEPTPSNASDGFDSASDAKPDVVERPRSPLFDVYVGRFGFGVNRVTEGRRSARATIEDRDGDLVLAASVRRGPHNLRIRGTVTPKSRNEFVLRGSISGVPDLSWRDAPPRRQTTRGRFTFRRTKGRSFWRLYEVNGRLCVCHDGCGNDFCYIDIGPRLDE